VVQRGHLIAPLSGVAPASARPFLSWLSSPACLLRSRLTTVTKNFGEDAAFAPIWRAEVQKMCQSGDDVHDFGRRRVLPRLDPPWPHED
jgi:hypothetical protein